MTNFPVVEGVTDPIDIQLKNNDQPFNATGMTVAAEIVSNTGYTVPMVGKVDWLDATRSRVRISPNGGDFLWAQSPYQLRILVTDTDGVSFAYPRFVAPDTITVGKP